MQVTSALKNKLKLHPNKDQQYSIFKNSVQRLLWKKFFNIQILNISMFKLHWKNVELLHRLHIRDDSSILKCSYSLIYGPINLKFDFLPKVFTLSEKSS